MISSRTFDQRFSYLTLEQPLPRSALMRILNSSVLNALAALESARAIFSRAQAASEQARAAFGSVKQLRSRPEQHFRLHLGLRSDTECISGGTFARPWGFRATLEAFSEAPAASSKRTKALGVPSEPELRLQTTLHCFRSQNPKRSSGCRTARVPQTSRWNLDIDM